MSARPARTLLALAAAAALAGLPGFNASASAQTSAIKVDRQEYSQPAAAQADPCQGSVSDVCVGTVGGQTGDQTYLHFDLSALPLGAELTGTTVTLVPDPANTAGNANSGSASLQACVLTQAIQGTFQSASPPAYNCTKAQASGKLSGDGSWTFDLTPLVKVWNQSGYSGAVILPAAAAAPAPAPLPAPPPAWSTAFARAQTAAQATYIAPPPLADQPLSAPQPAQVVNIPPQVITVPAAPQPVQSTAEPVAPAPSTHRVPVVVKHTIVRQDWLWATVAFIFAAMLLIVVVTLRGLRSKAMSLQSLRTSLVAARSTMAAPVALLSLGAALTLGSVGTAAFTHTVKVITDTPLNAATGLGPSAGPTSLQGPTTLTIGGGTTTIGGSAVYVPGHLLAGASTVKIGVTINNSAQKVAALLGVKLPSQGNLEAQVQVMVDYVNAHGGLAGHKVVADEIQVDTTSPDPAQWDKVCTQFAEDDHVLAAMATTGNQDTPFACYAQHHLLLLNGDAVQIDNQSYLADAPYVWIPSRPAADEGFLAEIQGLNSQGFFTPTGHLGVIVLDLPEYHKMYDNQVAPALASLGYSEPTKVSKAYIQNDFTASDAGRTIQEIQQAAVQFKINGVDRVIFMMPGGGSWLFFWEAAEQQQYHPTYGYSSFDEPYDLQEQNASQGGQNAGADQFKNAIGIGFEPSLDTGKEPFPNSDAEARCLAIYKAAGQTFAARLNAIAAEGTCNSFLLLQRAAAPLSPSQLTGENMAAVMSRLGAAYQSPLALPGGTRFLPGRPEGNDFYRFSHFDTGCNCFVYTSPESHQMPY